MGKPLSAGRGGGPIGMDGPLRTISVEDDFPLSGSGRWERIPRELPTGRPAMLHIFEPVEDGQTRGANQFYSVMETAENARFPAGNTASVGHSEGDVCSDD
ncbi:capsid protein of prophage [Escherichia coli]|nr:capsid protein of prophage [Escherichia coli]